MTDNSRPVVLVVDDHADDERANLRTWNDSLELIIRHPSEVTEHDVIDADLVLKQAYRAREMRGFLCAGAGLACDGF